jgi:hypothetical protein
VQLVSIVSTDPNPGDFMRADIGTDDRRFQLGATRKGKTYTVTYSATDLSGNTTATNAQITVVAKP